jgi:hypothetical protein
MPAFCAFVLCAERQSGLERLSRQLARLGVPWAPVEQFEAVAFQKAPTVMRPATF